MSIKQGDSMSIKKLSNIFTAEELEVLSNGLDYSAIPLDDNNNYVNYKLDNEGRGIHDELGRIQFGALKDLPKNILDKVKSIAKDSSDEELLMSHAMAVEYNSLYGNPNLPVHWDHDTNDLIINFQLKSNTRWDLGVALNVYELEDNSALVFNPNEHTHWRPHKTFKDGEYIKMIFFRFQKEDPSDYSHLDYNINDEIFKEIEEFRSSLGST